MARGLVSFARPRICAPLVRFCSLRHSVLATFAAMARRRCASPALLRRIDHRVRRSRMAWSAVV